MRFGYYVQMLAAFLLLAVGHYFTAAFLPIADCDETYNFVEPIHYLLYGNGMQTWENCPQYGLRSYFFAWIYAWPAILIRGAKALSSVDVYYFLRIFNGRVACLCELFFVYSVWSVFSGKAAMVTLVLLLLNYPVPHAAVSVLPTSFVMCLYFVALGCWLRTRSHTSRSWQSQAADTHPGAAAPNGNKKAAAGATGRSSSAPQQSQRACRFFVWATVALVVAACVLGWPFAGLIMVPCGLDLLLRFPTLSTVSFVTSLAAVCAVSYAVDTYYYGRPTLSAWNVVSYNMFGGDKHGPELYGTEPWYFFLKNLLLNFHIGFLASLAAPLVVLAKRRRSKTAAAAGVDGVSRGRLLLYLSPFFLWLTFWLFIPHKEERFFAPAYPFLLVAAVVTLTQVCFPDAPCRETAATPAGGVAGAGGKKSGKQRSPPAASKTRPLVYTAGVVFLLVFGLISFSRAMAVYHFYAGPERMLYDWYTLIQAEGALLSNEPHLQSSSQRRYTVCVGKEWYRFPSSFFLDHNVARYRFLPTASFNGALPLPFRTPDDVGSVGGLLNSLPFADRLKVEKNGSTFGSRACGAPGVNDENRAIPEQYVTDVVSDCDAVLDSLSADAEEKAKEAQELSLSAFPHSLLRVSALEMAVASQGQPYHPVDDQYAILDAARTPWWCRVLYYPFGITQKCARWRHLVLAGKAEMP